MSQVRSMTALITANRACRRTGLTDDIIWSFTTYTTSCPMHTPCTWIQVRVCVSVTVSVSVSVNRVTHAQNTECINVCSCR